MSNKGGVVRKEDVGIGMDYIINQLLVRRGQINLFFINIGVKQNTETAFM